MKTVFSLRHVPPVLPALLPTVTECCPNSILIDGEGKKLIKIVFADCAAAHFFVLKTCLYACSCACLQWMVELLVSFFPQVLLGEVVGWFSIMWRRGNCYVEHFTVMLCVRALHPHKFYIRRKQGWERKNEVSLLKRLRQTKHLNSPRLMVQNMPLTWLGQERSSLTLIQESSGTLSQVCGCVAVLKGWADMLRQWATRDAQYTYYTAETKLQAFLMHAAAAVQSGLMYTDHMQPPHLWPTLQNPD